MPRLDQGSSRKPGGSINRAFNTGKKVRHRDAYLEQWDRSDTEVNLFRRRNPNGSPKPARQLGRSPKTSYVHRRHREA